MMPVAARLTSTPTMYRDGVFPKINLLGESNAPTPIAAVSSKDRLGSLSSTLSSGFRKTILQGWCLKVKFVSYFVLHFLF